MKHRNKIIYRSAGNLTFEADSDGDLVVENPSNDYLVEYEAQELLDALKDHLEVEDTPAPVSARVLASDVSFNEGLLRLAVVHGKTVTFRYAKGDGSHIETRTLKPEDVKKVGDHLTFIGYDPDRDDVRAYRVDRMKGEVSVA